MRARVGVVMIALATAAPALGTGAAVASSAATVSCAAMTIAPARGSLVALTLSPVTVAKGGCVRFENHTATAAQVSVVGTTYRQSIRAGGATSGSSNFTATRSARVEAASGLRSGSAAITVRSATASPSASPSVRPSQSPTAPVSARPSATVSPTASASRSPKHRKGKLSVPPLPALPTSGASGAAAPSNPLVAPSGTQAGATAVSGSQEVPSATVIEPVTGSRRGLPVLVAAVVLAGVLCGYCRMILAVPKRPASRSRRARRT